MNQQSLFLTKSMEYPGNHDERLVEMATKLRKNRLQVPPFQRDFVWNRQRVKEWAETILSKQGIGTLVTYQLKQDIEEGDAPVYLADGLQRLTATNMFIDSPEHYGFSFGKDQATEYCDEFKITVQHRIYADHTEAMKAFQNLNKGTALIPAEFFRGELTLSEMGKYLYRRVPEIIQSYERNLILTSGTSKRRQQGVAVRDCFALFLQYITKTERRDFWSVANSNVTHGQVIERELAKTIEGWPQHSVEAELKNFETFMASQIATLIEFRKNVGEEHKLFSLTLLRWLLHLAIWRKNAKRPVALYEKFVMAMLESLKNYGSFRAQFPLPGSDPVDFVGLHIADLGQLPRLCIATGVPLIEKQERKRRPSPKGYHNSHILPFSEHGDGETILEPAMLNVARGANPIQSSSGSSNAP